MSINVKGYDTDNWLIIREGTIATNPGDQRWLLTLTGNINLELQGKKDSWVEDTLDFIPESFQTALLFTGMRPEQPAGSLNITVEQFTTLVTLSQIFHNNNADNAGYLVRKFRVVRPSGIFQNVTAELAVNGENRFIFNCGYHVTILGKIVNVPPIG